MTCMTCTKMHQVSTNTQQTSCSDDRFNLMLPCAQCRSAFHAAPRAFSDADDAVERQTTAKNKLEIIKALSRVMYIYMQTHYASSGIGGVIKISVNYRVFQTQ